jgi:phosphoribosylamine--glycine ligase
VKVLIVGGGGREHALAWQTARSARVERIYVAPGNAGTATEPGCENLPIAAGDIPSLLRFARREGVGLTLVGPEAPLCAGIVDAFEAQGMRCFGPGRAAAALEGSKSFAKDFMLRHGIPTAPYRSFTDAGEAIAYLQRQPPPFVVKADGLAGGKGVVIARDREEAAQALRSMLSGEDFGDAGRRVLIEGFLEGEEASFIALCDGLRCLPLATTQDHKRLRTGDRGPNTGGMGAHSPAPVVTPELHARILQEVMGPTLAGMVAEGRPYRGFLYAGLMIAPDGTPRVLEFNCRLGDPEAQVILLRLRSDLIEVIEAAFSGELAQRCLDWDPRPALAVVLAASGYPGTIRTGDVITGLETPADARIRVFHAGTARSDGALVTAGGRVAGVCALGDTLDEAGRCAYARVNAIRFPGMQYRTDIGHRALRGTSRPGAI